MICCHPLLLGTFLLIHGVRGSHGDVEIPSRARPDNPDPEPGLTPHHGSSLSALFGQAQSRLTACQDTTDALTGPLLQGCRLGLSPATQHGTAMGIPTLGIRQLMLARGILNSRSRKHHLCLCQGLRSVPREWGQRLDARILQKHPLTPWGKTLSGLGALQHTEITWHPCWTWLLA